MASYRRVGLVANWRTNKFHENLESRRTPGAGDEIRTHDIYLGKVGDIAVFCGFALVFPLSTQRISAVLRQALLCLCANWRTNDCWLISRTWQPVISSFAWRSSC